MPTTEEILAAVQNRINDIEVKIQTYEKERSENKTGAEVTRLDKLVAELKSELVELRKEKKDIKKEAKDEGAGGGKGKDDEKKESSILDDLNTLALDE